jgi:DNA polymerase III subunit epsilon
VTGPSLLERVAERLRQGPVHTLALAREVLGLEGHAGAASAAVFALLGADGRFRVDAGGVWTFAQGPVGPGLDRLSFAVVDVETTGGSPAAGHRITEIAVVEVSGGALAGEFSTLINPGRGIPPVVTALTGISTRMVERAPYFEHVAHDVSERLRDRVFVAHNAAFDHRFVRQELVEATGEAPDAPVLCTVQLARGLLPRLRRRNLDALAAHFGVPIQDRHRALGDAVATARVLIRLLDEAGQQGLHDLDTLRRVLRRRGRRSRRPRRDAPTTRESADEAGSDPTDPTREAP